MKNPKSILFIMLVFCFGIFFFSILDFLALHDIFNDYASPKVVERFGNMFSQELPSWTETSGEWGVVNLSFAFRLVSSFLLLFVLIYFLSKDKEKVNR